MEESTQRIILPSDKWRPLFEPNRLPIIIQDGKKVYGKFNSKRQIVDSNRKKVPETNIIDRGHQRTRYYVAFGGRNGAKSYTFGLAATLRSQEEKMTILCCRQIQSSIADSVMSVIENRINSLSLGFEFEILANTIRNKKTGTDFVFRGLKHNMNEIRSLEGTKICWVEEAKDVTDETWDTLDPTIREPNAEIWIGFNPDSIDDPVYKRFVLGADEDVTLINVNYTDNPHIAEDQLKLADKTKLLDYEKYQNIWLGIPRIAKEGGVFKPEHIKIVPAAPICTKWVRGWDFASSAVIDGSDPDWTVGAKLGVTSEGLYVISNIVRFRDTPDIVEKILLNTASVDGLGAEQSLPIDPGQAGKSQILSLTRILSGYRVHSSPESGDKVTRSEPFAAQVNVGNVVMVRDDLNDVTIKELTRFNGDGKSKDDIVDALSRAFTRLQLSYDMQYVKITGL
jgi:predicted phage terminase large subunit-like protein